MRSHKQDKEDLADCQEKLLSEINKRNALYFELEETQAELEATQAELAELSVTLGDLMSRYNKMLACVVTHGGQVDEDGVVWWK